MKYSFTKGLLKTLIQAFIWGMPLLVLQYPTWANLSLGALINLAVNYTKVKAQEAGYLQ